MRVPHALRVLATAAIVLSIVGTCGKSTSSAGTNPSRDNPGCTARSGHGSADLQVSFTGSRLDNQAITILVENSTGLDVGEITLGFPYAAPPAAVNGLVSAPVHSGEAVLRLNPKLQSWAIPDTEVPLTVKASGKTGDGKKDSAACKVKVKLKKLRERLLDCFRGASRFYSVKVNFYGTIERWAYSIDPGAIQGGNVIPLRADRTFTTPRDPEVRISQVRVLRVGKRMKVVETPVKYGVRSEEFGPNDYFHLRIRGPGNWRCETDPINLRLLRH
jgi:hypothetical protein